MPLPPGKKRKVTPKSLVLELLRVAPEPRAAPVNALLQVGALFGLSEGALRVAITRLMAARLLESDERGWYRLAPQASPLNTFIERWRLGEARLVPWDRTWLGLWRPRGLARSAAEEGLRSLSLLGFREGLDRLWLRPANLAMETSELLTLLGQLGLEREAELFRCSGLSEALKARLRTAWPLEALQAGCRSALHELNRSLPRLRKLPREEAVVETFLAGGEAIQALATDPLLPDELLPGEGRRALTEAMLRYDQAGRVIWQELLDERLIDLGNTKAT